MEEKQLQLVSYEQAKRLESLGFDWETHDMYWSDGDLGDCMGLFNHNIEDLYNEKTYSAPPVALALKWLRDKKKLFGYVYRWTICNKYCFSFYLDNEIKYGQLFETWEDAEIALLDELLNESQIVLGERMNNENN
jgi:hypothetical protein